MLSLSKSYYIERKPDFFFNKIAGVNSDWVLFDGSGAFGPIPAGTDLIYGSSFGIPQGTNPANLVNSILNRMPTTNPFFLERIRVNIPVYGLPVSPGTVLTLGNILKYNIAATGRSKVVIIPGQPLFVQSDKEGTTFEYIINELIDGNCAILPQLARNLNCTISFYVKFQELSYNMYE